MRGGRVIPADGVELNTKAARAGREGPNRYLACAGGLLVEDVTRDRALVQWIRQTALAGCGKTPETRYRQDVVNV